MTKKPTKKPWFLYILRCSDNSLYTGITTDIPRRIHEHNHDKKGAKYTKSRRPVSLLRQWSYCNQSQASKAEIRFKKFRKEKKEQLIKDQSSTI